MFRRKRRKQRGVWLPNVGQFDWAPGQPVGIQPSYIDSFIGFTVGGGRTPAVEFPLFEDGNSQQLTGLAAVQDEATKGLNDLIEWGYRLRRIVGHLVVSVTSGVTPGQPVPLNLAGLMVTAGIIVRKTTPLGTGVSLASQAGDINVNGYENVREPWLWRRSWPCLNCSVGLVAGSDPVGASDNADIVLSQSVYGAYDAGDIRSGPHIDSKVARVIGADERLFLDVSFKVRLNDSGPPTDWTANILFDYRGFATLRSNQGNRRNASR